MGAAVNGEVVQKFPLLGIGVSATTFERTLQELLDAPDGGERKRVHFCTTHTLVESRSNPELRAELLDAEIIAPDGMPLVWAGRLSGVEIERFCGPDVMLALIDRSREYGRRHFFYGGDEGVPEQLAAALSKRYPGLEVAGSYSPPFRALTVEEDEAIVEQINASNADYIWVGLGTPKQDLWIAEHWERLNASVLLAVGAAFDFHTDRVKRAPAWMQRIGMEWLFRLLSEPRRLGKRYAIANVKFLYFAGRQALGSILGRFSRRG